MICMSPLRFYRRSLREPGGNFRAIGKDSTVSHERQ